MPMPAFTPPENYAAWLDPAPLPPAARPATSSFIPLASRSTAPPTTIRNASLRPRHEPGLRRNRQTRQ